MLNKSLEQMCYGEANLLKLAADLFKHEIQFEVKQIFRKGTVMSDSLKQKHL